MERGKTGVGGIYYSQLNPLHPISVKTDINDPLSLFNHAVFTQLLLLIKTSLFFVPNSVFCFLSHRDTESSLRRNCTQYNNSCLSSCHLLLKDNSQNPPIARCLSSREFTSYSLCFRLLQIKSLSERGGRAVVEGRAMRGLDLGYCYCWAVLFGALQTEPEELQCRSLMITRGMYTSDLLHPFSHMQACRKESFYIHLKFYLFNQRALHAA